jgi:hypothetical protein
VEDAKGAEFAPGAGIDPSVTALTLARAATLDLTPGEKSEAATLRY